MSRGHRQPRASAPSGSARQLLPRCATRMRVSRWSSCILIWTWHDPGWRVFSALPLSPPTPRLTQKFNYHCCEHRLQLSTTAQPPVRAVSHDALVSGTSLLMSPASAAAVGLHMPQDADGVGGGSMNHYHGRGYSQTTRQCWSRRHDIC